MTINAHAGPYVAFKENPLGSIGTGSANQNAETGPSSFNHGSAFLDPRQPYTYYPGGGSYAPGGNPQGSNPFYAFMPGGAGYQCIDQVPSVISAVNIAASQSVTAATPMTLVSASGAGITVGVTITSAVTELPVTGLLAIDTQMAPLGFGQEAVVNLWDPAKAITRNVRVTTNADDTGGLYTVSGYDVYNYPMSEAITGVNNAVASGKKAFKYILSVTPSGTLNSTAVTVGTGDVYGLSLRCDRSPYFQAWWGAPQALMAGGSSGLVAAQETLTLPIPANTDLANGQVYNIVVPFDFTLVSAAYYVGKPVTTGAKAATLTMQVNDVSVGTGGVIALTSAAMTPTGAVIPATTISGTGTTGSSAKSAVTITIASPGVVTWPAHGLVAGTPVVFATTGALPTGLTAGTIYYVISAGLTANAFEVSATVGGSAVNTSGTQSGVQTATAYQTVGFVVSSVTAFIEGDGYVAIVVQNNDQSGGTFVPAVTTTATTTTGDVRGTIAMPSSSDGTKRLTVFISPSANNNAAALTTGLFGPPQNLAGGNNG